MKRVIVGVTGGIAIYKTCSLISFLVKRGIDVVVVMTKNATQFITPLTFETLTNNRVYVDTFDRDFEFEVEHISLAKSGDAFVIAPATANFMAKAVTGVADDMLTTTFLAFKGLKVICPAMNTGMWDDEATQSNMKVLKERGIQFVEPISGWLACRDDGKGKMQEPEVIGQYVLDNLNIKSDLLDKRVFITAGGTIEDIDGVRYMSNYSSGKMGLALAEEALSRGADVTLVTGNVSVDIPKYFNNIKIKSTMDMYNCAKENIDCHDIFIMSAAPCDFRVQEKFEQKIKVKDLTLSFVKNPDIACMIGEQIEKSDDKKLVVFAAETQNVIENAKGKLLAKKANMVVANDLKEDGAGFLSDTNKVIIINNRGEEFKTEVLSKRDIASIILDRAIEL